MDAQAEFYRVTNTEPAELTQPVPDATKIPASLAEAKELAQKMHPTLLSADQDIEATRYQYEASKSNLSKTDTRGQQRYLQE